MENHIIIAIVLIIIVAAALRARKHFKGGCCSSGSTTIRDRKTLNEPIIGRKTMLIEGMHCENCQIRVENALNRLDGILCSVNLKKKTAAISCSREVSNDILKEIVEKLGYTVTEIR